LYPYNYNREILLYLKLAYVKLMLWKLIIYFVVSYPVDGLYFYKRFYEVVGSLLIRFHKTTYYLTILSKNYKLRTCLVEILCEK
jgi:hypothetical protein